MKTGQAVRGEGEKMKAKVRKQCVQAANKSQSVLDIVKTFQDDR